ncbi:MAG TPA: TonB-dependent receptor [Sphingobium sp.]
MISGTKALLSTALSTIALGTSAQAQVSASPNSPGTAIATPAASPGDEQVAGDIVVTAQKREQRLIDVPVAITAINSEALTTQNLNRIQDFYDRVPGLQYSGQRVSNLSLRGISTGGATNPTIAILVDDVPFGSSITAGQPPIPDFDASVTDRIEVLRGPQGTLYGAASLGGLIKYVLKQPDTKEVSGRLELGGTSLSHGDEGYSARGSINVPITDWLAVSASGFYRDDARYIDNQLTGKKDTNSRKIWGFRAAALVKPTDNLTITGSALKQKVDALNSDLQITTGGVPICVACTTGGTAATRATAPTTFEPVYGDLSLRTLDSPNKSQFELYTGRAELDLGGATITSISAWSVTNNVISSDLTPSFPFIPPLYGSPAGSGVLVDTTDRTTKFSQELRAGGAIGSVDWLVGGFYTVEHAATDQAIRVIAASGPVATAYAGLGPNRYRELAGFADFTWHVTEKFEVQAGGRYAGNRRTSTSQAVVDTPAVPVYGSSSTQVSRSSDNAFTWLLSPTYHFSRNLMVYGRIASGYRPGGPNLTVAGVGAYGSDRVVNYEIGFKGRVVPGLLTIDTAVFQIDWKNIQLQGTTPSQLGIITNGGKARSRGVEFAANLTPWHGMSIDGALALTDAELTETLPAAGTGSLRGADGDRLPFTAKTTASLTALQRLDLSERLAASISANYTYVGDRFSGFSQVNGTRPRILIPSYDTLNFTAALTLDKAWSATFYLRNAADTRGIAAAQNRNGTSVPTALFIQPRTVGLTLGYNF